MIAGSLLGLSLGLSLSLSPPVTTIAFEPRTDVAMRPAPLPDISIRKKESTLLPLVMRATECIINRVAADPRYESDARPTSMNDLIIDSIPACAKPVRAMIDAHDKLYGSGSGEAFLLGPYLDVLPGAIVRQAKVRR